MVVGTGPGVAFLVGNHHVPSVVATGAAIGDKVTGFPTFLGPFGEAAGILSAVDADDRVGNLHVSKLAHPPMSGNDQPFIILVRPQLGENIGMCARAMLNCGLERLRLVSPRDPWPNPAARAAAADADRVIDGAELFDDLDEAIGDCRHVVAASARIRSLPAPVAGPAELAANIVRWSGAGERVAVLFGAEASGLDNESIARAEWLLRFPTNPAFSSLNLAQSVLLFAWEWMEAARPGPIGLPEASAEPPATRHELTGFLNRLERSLDERGFFLTPGQKPGAVNTLRGLFAKAAPTGRELAMLQGMLTALSKPPSRETEVDQQG